MINMLSDIDQTEFMLAAPQNFIPFDLILLTVDD
jgi:hypothetical protein